MQLAMCQEERGEFASSATQFSGLGEVDLYGVAPKTQSLTIIGVPTLDH